MTGSNHTRGRSHIIDGWVDCYAHTGYFLRWGGVVIRYLKFCSQYIVRRQL